ncbi:non-ribosomal peptide synthetase [Antrihabitans stalactiti]|uniref:Phenyloxazoline synthase MbtB n=1 Tax=Antrihabitans stalactiti TaxID=2584121 RepID=A0A848KCJ0_9NOCA|nr:non-ribosomal peptide synthetase [Antrihabitans stalactiti]NMN95268.1 amino acid adenylation domain-containing protein [Antrihabitans stalactiti]
MTTGFPDVRPAPEDRYEPFPITDTQLAYVLGREDSYEYGGVAAHGYYEYEGAIDSARFTAVWNRLIERHDALRLVVDVDLRQQRIVPTVPTFEPTEHDLRGLSVGERDAKLAELRTTYSHVVIDPGTWPLWHVAISRIDDQVSRIHIGFDGLCFDYLSWRLLLAELTALYADPAAELPAIELSFRDYVLATEELGSSELYLRSERYWTKRLASFPSAPVLPAGSGNGEGRANTRFTRREAGLEPRRWQELTTRARSLGLTPSAFMMAAFGEVLAAWSGETRFALNIPGMNRLPLHPEVEKVIGEFASVSVLEIDHDPAATFIERAERIQDTLWDDLEYSHYSGLRFMRELTRRDGNSNRARMPIVLTSTLGWSDGERTPLDGRVTEIFSLSQTPQVSLDVQIHEADGELYYNWDTVDSAFAPGLIDDMFTAFRELLERLADSAELWDQTDIGVVPLSEARLDGRHLDRGTDLVPDLFVARATSRPNHPALIDGPTTITYGQLLDQVNRIGNALALQDDRPIVAVLVGKGWQQFAAVYAVLTSGGAYLPIDVSLPADRVRSILERSGAAAALTESTLRPDLRDAVAQSVSVLVDVDGPAVADAATERTHLASAASDLAYVLFTSGSTGVPKGVMVEHGGLVNCVLDTVETFDVSTADASIAVSALHHDMSGFDVFVALTAGSTVVIPDADRHRDPEHWSDLVADHRVTLWCSVPAMLDMLGSAATTQLPSLRLALTGGDWVPPQLLGKLRERAANVGLISIGGPTETTLWNIWRRVDVVDPAWRSVPYGVPIANTSYLLLDSGLRPVPAGVVGEMYCAGPGVARGYLGDPERTAASFPLHPATGERLFRTGDYGRRMAGGEIEFVGRRDRQVKIGGHRVELGDVESALASLPAVETAVVTPVVAGDGHSCRALVAHVVGDSDAGTIGGALLELLPLHMVPATFRFVDALPLTANNKVDYRALTAIGAGAPVSVTRREPSTALEKVVAAVWQEILNVPDVAVDDNFYALGGDSVIAITVTKELREVLVDPGIDLRMLLDSLTVERLAKNLLAAEPMPGRLNEVAGIYLEILALSDAEIATELREQH